MDTCFRACAQRRLCEQSRGMALAEIHGVLKQCLNRHRLGERRKCQQTLSKSVTFASSNSRMRSKGSRFTLGVWGLRCVRRTPRLCSQPSATIRNRPQPSATVRNRPQPFATVRNRSQPSATVRNRNRSRDGRMDVPMGSAAKGATFEGFQRRLALFRVAVVALRDIPTCFMTCQNWFCVAGAILLQRFQKIRSIFRCRRSTSDVSCCVFFANRTVSAAPSGDKVQIPWQAWHFVTCDENRWKPRTKRRLFEVKLVGKN